LFYQKLLPESSISSRIKTNKCCAMGGTRKGAHFFLITFVYFWMNFNQISESDKSNDMTWSRKKCDELITLNILILTFKEDFFTGNFSNAWISFQISSPKNKHIILFNYLLFLLLSLWTFQRSLNEIIQTREHLNNTFQIFCAFVVESFCQNKFEIE
jgi:hypothetical protein